MDNLFHVMPGAMVSEQSSAVSKRKSDNRDLARGAAAGAAAGAGVGTAGVGGLFAHHARKMRIAGTSYKDMSFRPSKAHLKYIGTRAVLPAAVVGAAGGLAAAGANNRSRKKQVAKREGRLTMTPQHSAYLKQKRLMPPTKPPRPGQSRVIAQGPGWASINVAKRVRTKQSSAVAKEWKQGYRNKKRAYHLKRADKWTKRWHDLDADTSMPYKKFQRKQMKAYDNLDYHRDKLHEMGFDEYGRKKVSKGWGAGVASRAANTSRKAKMARNLENYRYKRDFRRDIASQDFADRSFGKVRNFVERFDYDPATRSRRLAAPGLKTSPPRGRSLTRSDKSYAGLPGGGNASFTGQGVGNKGGARVDYQFTGNKRVRKSFTPRLRRLPNMSPLPTEIKRLPMREQRRLAEERSTRAYERANRYLKSTRRYNDWDDVGKAFAPNSEVSKSK